MTDGAAIAAGEASRRPPEVIVAGHVCLDVIPTLLGSGLAFSPGKLVEAGPVVLAAGGAVPNTGLSLHRLGVAVRLMGKVGDDLFANAVRRIVASHGPGLDEGMVTSPGEPTSYSIILSPPGADRMFIHAPGCNATFDGDDIDYDAVASARLFHFGYPPLMEKTFTNGGETLVSLFRRAKDTGVTTSLDLSMPDMGGSAGRVNWAALFGKALPAVDIFLPSVEELLLTLRPEEYRCLLSDAGEGGLLDLVTPELLASLGDELLTLGVKICVIKMGHRGVYLHTAGRNALAGLGRAQPGCIGDWADRQLWAPCFAVDVVGTTGSGDATIAGFLMGLLHNMPPEQCVMAACAVGACNVEAADALSGIRPWEDTLARVRAGWRRHPMHITSAGWTWDEQEAVWHGPVTRTAHCV